MSPERLFSQAKRLLVGEPIPSHLAHHERLSRVTGLAVLSSDALSSVAYATEEILRVLLVGGVGALALVTPIGAAIAVILAIVAFSYRQTIHAYPSGGGAYIVAKDNLGRLPSLIGGGRAADRLRPDRGRQRRRRGRRRHVGIPGPARQPGGNRPRVRRPAGDREPARHSRVGAHLRGPHLLLHRQHLRPDGARRLAVLHRVAGARAGGHVPWPSRTPAT